MKWDVRGTVLIALWLLSVPTSALDLTMAAELGSEYSNNTLLSEDERVSEWTILPGVSLYAGQDTATLEMDVRYDYLRRIYTKDYWQDENRLTGDASINWHAIAERLDFFAGNVRTESTERSWETSTPANRQIISTTEAGSRLRFQPRSADELQLEYLFRDIDTTRTNTNSQRHNGTIRYLAGISENRGLTLQGTYSDIEYDGLFPNAEYWLSMIGYRQTTGLIELDINGGYNWYDRVDRGKTSGTAFDATLTWNLSRDAALTLSGSQMITDQSSQLSSGNNATENTEVNAAFEETIGEIDYEHTFGANQITIASFWIKQDYASDVPLTNTRIGGRIDFTRALTRTIGFRVYGELSNRDYDDIDDDQDEVRAGLSISHQIGRSLDFQWGARYETRDSQRGFDYEVWYADLLLTWTFLGARR